MLGLEIIRFQSKNFRIPWGFIGCIHRFTPVKLWVWATGFEDKLTNPSLRVQPTFSQIVEFCWQISPPRNAFSKRENELSGLMKYCEILVYPDWLRNLAGKQLNEPGKANRECVVVRVEHEEEISNASAVLLETFLWLEKRDPIKVDSDSDCWMLADFLETPILMVI